MPDPTHPSAGPPSSPPDLDRVLDSRLGSCRLVFELLDEATLDAIDGAVDWLKQRDAHLPDLLAARYPALLTCHLVAEAIDGYTAGTFWSNLRYACTQKEQELMGEAFLRTLRTRGLETFDFLGAQGMRFVTPILAHAGMPRYCLEDFFFKLLVRELRKGLGSTASELLATWRARKTAFVGIDKPVERFLLFGGETAVDLLDRCIDLISETARTAAVPDGGALGLPRHIVEAFAQGWGKEGRKSVAFASGRAAVPPPVVRIDPWDPLGPILELPVVPESLAAESWTIENGPGVEVLRASLMRMQQRRLLPAQHWTVSLSRRGDAPRTFVFEWLPQTGVAAFDPSSGLLARDSRVIPWNRAWLLHPSEVKLEARARDGHPLHLRATQDLPAPVGAWSGYSLAEYNLADVASISATRSTASGGAAEESLRILHPTAGRPVLEGTPVAGVRTDAGLPVYAAPPVLRFPPSTGRAWRVRLRIVERSIERTVDQGELPLDASLLDVDVAYIHVLATGPIGMDLRESFALVRGVAVRRPPRLVLPKDSAWFEIHASPSVRIVHGAGRISLPPGADTMSCEVAGKTGDLKLLVSVPRLVWAVTKPGTSAAQQFDTRVERIGLDELGSGGSWGGALSISTRCPELALRLELSGPDGTCRQRSSVELASARDGRALFHLAPFRDTAIATGATSLRLDLWLVDVPASVQVGELHTHVSLTDLRVTHVPMPDGSSAFDVVFDETVRFKRREMRLWSQGRPWESSPVVRLDIPDDATRHTVLLAPRDTNVTPGRYLAEIDIRDDWTSPSRPHRRASNAASVVVGGPASHREQLQARANHDPLAVVELLMEGGILQRTLSRDEVRTAGEALVAALASLRSGELGDERARDALVGVLRSQPDLAVRAIAARRESMSWSGVLKLGIRLLPFGSVDLDEDWEASARGCWSACASLAGQVDVPLALGGWDDARARCREFLGWDEAEWPVSSRAPRESEFAPSQAELGLDAERIDRLRQECALVPSALLTRDEYADLSFEWLLEKRRAETWLDEFHNLSRVAQAMDATEPARLCIESRKPQAGTVNLASFPQLTLVAAIVLVRSAAAETEVSMFARRALLGAVPFAPRLVAFDLVLAAVLTQWRPPESPCSTP